MKIECTLVRIYVSSENIEDVISFYEKLTGEKAVGRFKYEEKKLEIVRVGGFLIIAGSEEALKSFRNTSATVKVDDLREFREYILNNGGQVLDDIKKVPTGENMIMRHKDGTIIEYVQHDENTPRNIDNLDKFLMIDGIYAEPDTNTMEMLEKASDTDYVIKNIPDKLSIKPDIL